MSVPAGGARMWSWRLHSYGGGAALERARRPARRGVDQLLVRVTAAALNPIDHAMLEGYGRCLLGVLRSWEGRARDELPLVVGREFVGELVGAGAAAGAAAGAGRRVWGVLPPHWPGALSQYVLVRKDWISPQPVAMDEYGASGTLYAGLTACAALRAAGVEPGGAGAGGGVGGGGRLLVAGLGAVGAACVQLARRCGCDVTVLAAAGAAPAARALGAHLIDRHNPDLDAALRDAGPFHAVLDCAGLGGAEAGRRRWQFRRYVTLSSPLLGDTDRAGALWGAAGAALRGARHSLAAAWGPQGGQGGPAGGAPGQGGLLPPHVRWAFFQPNQQDIQLLRKLAERGQLVTQVDRVIPWKCADAVLNGGEKEKAPSAGARGKIVLDFRDDTPPEHWREKH